MLDGTFALIQARIEARPHEIMPASRLPSQFAILEPLQNDERGMCVDIRWAPGEIVSQIETELHDHFERGQPVRIGLHLTPLMSEVFII